ncbi:TIR domain-containing protein [Rhizobium leguminosarum]
MSDKASELEKNNFDVFISFVAQTDYKAARLIKNFLGSFHKRVDASGLKVPEIKAFMDTDNLRRSVNSSGSQDLGDSLRSALSNSKNLLVLCSHATPSSYWVRSEFQWYVSLRGSKTVLLGVTEPLDPTNTAAKFFPTYVTEHGLEKQLWYDFRSVRVRKRDGIRPRPIEDVLTQLAAHLTGRSVEETTSAWYREQRRIARMRSYYIAAIAVATVVAVIAGSVAYLSHQTAERSMADKLIQQGLKAEADADIVSAATAYAQSLSHADTRIARFQIAGLLKTPVSPIKLFQLPVTGAEGELSAVAFVAKQSFAIGDKAGNLMLLDIESGVVTRLATMASGINALAFFPISNRLAAGLAGGDVISIDLATGKSTQIRKLNQPILGLKAESERELLAIGVANDAGVFVLDKDGKQMMDLDTHTDDVQALAFNADGTYLYFGGSSPYIWACPVSNDQCSMITRVEQYVYSISASATTRYSLATVGDQVLLFDHALQKMDTLSKSGGAHFYASSFDPSSQFVAVASSRGFIEVFDVQAKRAILNTRGHQGESYALAFNSTGDKLVSVGLDGTVMVWNLVRDAAVMPSQKFTPTAQMLTPPQRNQIIDMRVLDDKLAVVALADMSNRIYELPSLLPTPLDDSPADMRGKLASSFVRARGRAAFGQFDPIAVWKSEHEAAASALDKLSIEATASAISRDGRFVALVSKTGDVYILDSSKDIAVKGPTKIANTTAIAFVSSESPSIAVADGDGKLTMLTISDLTQQYSRTIHSGAVRAMVYSEAARTLVAIGDDGFVGAIDPATTHVRKSVTDAGAQSLAVAPNGKVAAVGSLTGTIEIFDITSMESLARLSANQGGVNAMDFDPRGRYLYSGGFDEALRRWDIDSITSASFGKVDDVLASTAAIEMPKAIKLSKSSNSE